MMTILKVDETLNGTKTEEKRLAEEVENHVAADLKALQEVAEETMREAAAVEKALKEEADIAMPFGRPAIVSAAGTGRGSFRASEGEEPVYIYYNSAVTPALSPFLLALTAAAAALLLPYRRH